MSNSFTRTMFQRLQTPTPAEVLAARKRAGLTQTEAAQLVSSALSSPYRTWQGYEIPKDKKGHRTISVAAWELFLLLTNQHPRYQITERDDLK